MNLVPAKWLIFALFFVFTTASYAQYGLGFTKKDKIKDTELIVVLDDKINTDGLKAAFERVWTHNPYRILKREEVKQNIDEYRGNPKYSFLHFRYEHEIIGGPILAMGCYNRILIISFSITKEAKPGKLPVLSAMASTMDSLMSSEAEFVKDLWFLQQQLNDTGPTALYKVDKVITEKTLLIPQAILFKKTAEDFKFYPYKFKIATAQEITDAILNKTPDTVVMDLTLYPSSLLTYTDVNTEKVVYQCTAQGLNGYFQRNLQAIMDRLEKAKK